MLADTRHFELPVVRTLGILGVLILGMIDLVLRSMVGGEVAVSQAPLFDVQNISMRTVWR